MFFGLFGVFFDFVFGSLQFVNCVDVEKCFKFGIQLFNHKGGEI